MSTKFSYVVTIILLLASLALAVYVYPLLPENVASHWNAMGEVNGYMSRIWGVLLLPLILVGLSSLFFVLPKIDPLRENVRSFRREYNLVIVSLLLFLFFVNALTLVWNMGLHFNMGRYIVGATGLLFLEIGYLLPRTKRNWFFGIRTPWTLSSDSVWEKTHTLGGKLFSTTGILTLLSSVLFPGYMFFVLLSLVIVAVLVTLAYSYLVYRREECL